jgi:4-hydroxy-3-methylbut-2-enyl diphosphate reductase
MEMFGKSQQEVKNLAKRVDAVLILGSKSSANTKRLFEISKKINKNTLWLENAGDFKKGIINSRETIGISSGTSAPDFVIKEIVKKINNIFSQGVSSR